MTTTEASTPELAAGRQVDIARRRLALDWAHDVLEAPASTPADVQSGNLRHVVLVLVDELERADADADRLYRDAYDTGRMHAGGLAQARRALEDGARVSTRRTAGPGEHVVCPGSNAFVEADSTDGAGVGPCPSCSRPRPTTPIPGCDRFRVIGAHLERQPLAEGGIVTGPTVAVGE